MKLADAFLDINQHVPKQDCIYSKLLKNAGVPHGFIPAPDAPPPETLIMQQKHTTDIVEINDRTVPSIADGLICKMGRPIAVQTADCVPILTYQPDHVGALHCGWKGTADGMLDEYFHYCTSRSLDFKKSVYVLGPAIYPPHYQIRNDVLKELSTWAGNDILKEATTREDDEHLQLDLSKAIVLYLLTKGVPPKQIEWIKVNTYTHPKLHSYRRDGKSAGRNYSWIKHVS